MYEGRTVLGWPEMTFQRGKPVLAHGEVVARAGQGHFLPTLEPGTLNVTTDQPAPKLAAS